MMANFERTRIYADGKKVLLIGKDYSLLLDDYLLSSLSIEYGHERIATYGQPSFLVQTDQTALFQVQSCMFKVFDSPDSEQQLKKMMSAWKLPVNELLKIVHLKLNQRDESDNEYEAI